MVWVDRLEVPETFVLSFSSLGMRRVSLGAVAPLVVDCSRNCSTCLAKLRNPADCLSRDFCLSPNFSNESHSLDMVCVFISNLPNLGQKCLLNGCPCFHMRSPLFGDWGCHPRLYSVF